MKRHVFALLGIVLLLVSVVSCIAPETNASTKQTDTFVRKSDFDALEAKIEQYRKENTESLKKVQEQLDGLDFSDYYTEKEVNNAVAAAVRKLKNDQSWIETTTTTTTTPAPTPTGSVTWLTNPSDIQTLGTQQVCYTLKITNGTAQWVYIRPIININLHTGQSPLSSALTDPTVTLTVSGASGNITDADFMGTYTNTSAIMVSNKEIQLGAGITVDLLVCAQVTHADARIWDIVSSINWRSL